MFLSPYFSERDGVVFVSGTQASHFAKGVAGDFNPLHDEGAKKFCVPGDLLFAMVLERYGVFSNMNFHFLSTVGDGTGLNFPEHAVSEFEITNERDKAVMDVQLSGDCRQNDVLSEALIREYVSFSGLNFPHVLEPLMAEKEVMINPSRPLVMYLSMSLHLDTLDIDELRLSHAGATLSVDGKRGDVSLYFDVYNGDQLIGKGEKKLALGGLKPYDKDAMAAVIKAYAALKETYTPNS